MRSYRVIIDKRGTTYESDKNIIPAFISRVKLENVQFDSITLVFSTNMLISELYLFSLKAIVSQNSSRTLNFVNNYLNINSSGAIEFSVKHFKLSPFPFPLPAVSFGIHSFVFIHSILNYSTRHTLMGEIN